jgi:hypothetical protein
MSILLKQEIKYYIINTDVTNNLSLKKRIPCIQYEINKTKTTAIQLLLVKSVYGLFSW